MRTTSHAAQQTDTVYLGAGCFWCTEAIFLRTSGVSAVDCGYQGGTVENPTYQEVCSGTTGHAEVCRIAYDPDAITLPELLGQFWQMHDPTSLNRQGADVGTQYRSVIFCSTEEQLRVAKAEIAKLNSSGRYSRPIVTEVAMAPAFYLAEEHHQEYYENNSNQPYCTFVIEPKLKKQAAHSAETNSE